MKPSSRNRLYDTILDSINEGVFTVDLERRVLSFNAAAERITGISRKEAEGRKCSEIIRADLCRSSCAMERTLRSGNPVVNATTHITTSKGERIPVRIATALLRDEKGTVIGGVETFQDLSQVEQLRKALEARYTFKDIIGRSPAMTKLFATLPLVAESESTVLIQGATGTGKELFARTIHNLSPRRKGRFVAVNCAALPDTLLESELFGYKAGAFTDAKQDKPGRFELARGGTIFLDEICDLNPVVQVRLLRVLQERYIEPLGGVTPTKVDVRIIAAAKMDLAELVKKGTFRDDLYYRIRVVHLVLPPLEQRRGDIPLLVNHLVTKFNHLQGKAVTGLSERAMARLLAHDYPGNVRELENIIEQAFVLCRGERIRYRHLPRELRRTDTSFDHAHTPRSLKDMERALIRDALQRNDGNRSHTARELGINPSTLYRKMQRLGITHEAAGQ
ncbi:sigma-54 interaction domain-containing protein [Pseudodesulfovibrio senegalensis]|uniref:PAS domain S-box protein n=1 Tax=Pseudodesulfovibrio senegalensis TaxID=1721087 RepID=A0A6N6N4U6_9BACT|nr:sigma 54-interacting transcriptional regulator [Pseudodesulfovibrio senegalensis]KAB1443202.1 PAS domain S-box protein [Pseudodesulfovibrio senegalensis]